jgi:hypothetical protein
MNFINSPTRAVAPRLPCNSPNCKLCDKHHIQIEIKVETQTKRPTLQWITDLPEGLLPHLAYSVTPPRF